jgi:hypothetical protein
MDYGTVNVVMKFIYFFLDSTKPSGRGGLKKIMLGRMCKHKFTWNFMLFYVFLCSMF